MAKGGTTMEFGIQECSKCEYKLRCKECVYSHVDEDSVIISKEEYERYNKTMNPSKYRKEGVKQFIKLIEKLTYPEGGDGEGVVGLNDIYITAKKHFNIETAKDPDICTHYDPENLRCMGVKGMPDCYCCGLLRHCTKYPELRKKHSNNKE